MYLATPDVPAVRPRSAMTLVEVVVALAIVGLLVALTLPAVQKSREAAARTACRNNLKQIGLATHLYHDAHQRFPPGMSSPGGDPGHPYLSWLARILPYLEHEALWQTTETAFQQSANPFRDPPHVGFGTVIRTYGCPIDSRTASTAEVVGLTVAFTSYLGVSGTNLFAHDGALFPDSRVRLNDVTDGTSTTLLAGERPPGATLFYGSWYAGYGQLGTGSGDMILGVRELLYAAPPGPGGILLCSRGPYSFVPANINDRCNKLHFWSLHPGGGHFLMCDGSVHFFAYSCDSAMPALATRSCGEIVACPE